MKPALQFALGRGLQILGMAIVLLGFVAGISYNSERWEFLMLGIGGVIFVIGLLLLRPFKH